MHFKLSRLRNSLSFLILCLITFNTFGQSQIKKDCATFIKVSLINNNDELWSLNYIKIKDKYFSGDYFIGHNFTCDFSNRKSFYTNLRTKITDDKIMEFEDKIENTNYKSLKTNNLELDSIFYYKCVEVPISYIELPCKIETPDFFKFLFNNNNGLEIIDIETKKVKVKKIPKTFNKKVIENNECLLLLKKSYNDFEKCVK